MSLVGVVVGKNPPALPPRAGAPERSGGGESRAKGAVLKKVVLVSPAIAEANNGNWHTAHRWSQFLAGYCDIQLLPQWPSKTPVATSLPPELMIALHARRSAPSIAAWASAQPDKPLVVVLTGTDLYRDIVDDPVAQQSLSLASHLVVLQGAGLQALPPAWRDKAHVIYQSAAALKPAHKSTRFFRVVMVGHLRGEKDPLTFMAAAGAGLPPHIRFDQIGEALDADLGRAAQTTANSCPHYRWLGGLPRASTRQHIKRAHLLVNSSVMEGGAHVILEAVLSGTPVLASRISGNVGMLGDDYEGYFDVGNSQQLSQLVARCASDAGFLARLQRQCAQRAALFDPALEKSLVLNLVVSALSPRNP